MEIYHCYVKVVGGRRTNNKVVLTPIGKKELEENKELKKTLFYLGKCDQEGKLLSEATAQTTAQDSKVTHAEQSDATNTVKDIVEDKTGAAKDITQVASEKANEEKGNLNSSETQEEEKNEVVDETATAAESETSEKANEETTTEETKD